LVTTLVWRANKSPAPLNDKTDASANDAALTEKAQLLATFPPAITAEGEVPAWQASQSNDTPDEARNSPDEHRTDKSYYRGLPEDSRILLEGLAQEVAHQRDAYLGVSHIFTHPPRPRDIAQWQ